MATAMNSPKREHRAVIFDLGGVVLGSPLHAIAAYERRNDIPANAINRIVIDTGPEGAWSRLERGELEMDDFFVEFERDCADAGHRVDARELMTRMGEAAAPRPAMLDAVRRIRSRGLLAAALTNNWIGEGDGTRVLAPHFDVFVESSVVGLRKPDPAIYHYACAQMKIVPREAIFLDDIGRNLKAASALGMTTIKVGDPEEALDRLSSILGFSLRG